MLFGAGLSRNQANVKASLCRAWLAIQHEPSIAIAFAGGAVADVYEFTRQHLIVGLLRDKKFTTLVTDTSTFFPEPTQSAIATLIRRRPLFAEST